MKRDRSTMEQSGRDVEQVLELCQLPEYWKDFGS